MIGSTLILSMAMIGQSSCSTGRCYSPAVYRGVPAASPAQFPVQYEKVDAAGQAWRHQDPAHLDWWINTRNAQLAARPRLAAIPTEPPPGKPDPPKPKPKIAVPPGVSTALANGVDAKGMALTAHEGWDTNHPKFVAEMTAPGQEVPLPLDGPAKAELPDYLAIARAWLQKANAGGQDTPAYGILGVTVILFALYFRKA